VAVDREIGLDRLCEGVVVGDGVGGDHLAGGERALGIPVGTVGAACFQE
jgi:hypothetical protein